MMDSKEIKNKEGKQTFTLVWYKELLQFDYDSIHKLTLHFFSLAPIRSTGGISKALHDNHRKCLPLMTGSAGESVSTTIGRTMTLRRTWPEKAAKMATSTKRSFWVEMNSKGLERDSLSINNKHSFHSVFLPLLLPFTPSCKFLFVPPSLSSFPGHKPSAI